MGNGSQLIPGQPGTVAGTASDTATLSDPLVVINELMADPTPLAGLPDREYIELFNRQKIPVNLKGWILGLGPKQKILPDVSIPAGGFLLLSSSGGTKDLLEFGRVTEVSGLTLTNSGLGVSLYDAQRKLQDMVRYEPSMHRKGYEEGGYSLERIDPGRSCGQHYNWSTTLSEKGGTPGAENSVKAINPDLVKPFIVSKTLIDSHILAIQFSERFILPPNPAGGLAGILADAAIDSIGYDEKNCMLYVYFPPSSVGNGMKYSIVIRGLSDECGNAMPDQTVSFGFYLPVRSDILISEVLFNPFTDGSEFVEIYNNCSRDVDLSGLFLATRDGSNILKQISQLSPVQAYLSPGSYLAVSKSVEGILRYYRSKCDSCLLQTDRFPVLADQSGSVVLLGRKNEIIDEMKYSGSMHHPFIADNEGISLERVSFEIPSFQVQNWHSAAKNAGFATPGYKNSMKEVPDSAGSVIAVESAVFSPNGDGISDHLRICFNGIKPGAFINIRIYNSEGTAVRNLANNLTIGSSDLIEWDGLGDNCRMVPPGIYVLNISLFDQTGKQKKIKRACVLTDHL